jgi:hypothetical protein
MASLIYEIINEFRFEAQSALINMDAVQNAAAGISNSIDNLFKKVSIIPQMLSSSLGMSFGASGLLYGAVSSFENLQKNSLAFANIISSNLDSLEGPIGTFNERMAASDALLKDFAKTAQKFSLDEGAFIQTTKMLTAQLVPKGLAGTNFGTAKEMSRGLLKSAPILGVDPNFVQGELLRSMEGSASLNDTLFRRLAAETKVFRDLKKGVVSEDVQKAGGFKGDVKVFDSISKMFNALPAASRVEVLTQALTQFGDDADVAAGNANLLSNKLMAIKNQLTGVAGVLQPIGAVIVPKLRMILEFISKMIETHVRPAFLRLSQAIEVAADNPERLFATMYQMRELQNDLNLVGKIAAFMPILLGIKFLFQIFGKFPQAVQAFGTGIIAVFKKIGLERFGIQIAAFLNTLLLGRVAKIIGAFSLGSIFKFIGKGVLISALVAVVTGIGTFILALFNMKKVIGSILFVFNGLAWVLRRILAPIILSTLAFQTLSRAMGYAKILDAKNIYDMAPQFEQVFSRIVKVIAQILKPIDDIVDSIARMISPLFGMTYIAGQDILGKILWVFEGLAKALEFVRDIFINFLANLQGIFFALFRTFEVFTNMFSNLLTGLADLFKNFFNSILSGDLSGAMSLKPLTDKLTPFSEIGVAYNAGYEDIVGRYMSDINNPNKKDKAIVNRNTNIDKVVINNAFKEQLEPDRIANSLVKTLMEVADNPRQGATGGLATGFFR